MDKLAFLYLLRTHYSLQNETDSYHTKTHQLASFPGSILMKKEVVVKAKVPDAAAINWL
jgi:hypothetical protein